jgi:cytochrome c
MCHLFAHEPQRGALLVAQIAGADAAAPCQADRWCDAVQAAMCDLPHQEFHPSRYGKVRRCTGSSAGRPVLCRFREGRNFVWDDARLDAWLANPQAIIPGAIMAYRQPKAETRAAIIAYLKELN